MITYWCGRDIRTLTDAELDAALDHAERLLASKDDARDNDYILRILPCVTAMVDERNSLKRKVFPMV